VDFRPHMRLVAMANAISTRFDTPCPGMPPTQCDHGSVPAVRTATSFGNDSARARAFEEASERALAESFAKGDLRKVTRLYRNQEIPEERCWVRRPGWCLAYS
jgi:hypothetical protein